MMPFWVPIILQAYLYSPAPGIRHILDHQVFSGGTVHKLLKQRMLLKDLSLKKIFLNKFIYLCIYFWLHWVFVAVCRLSLVVESGGYSSLRCADFSLR